MKKKNTIASLILEALSISEEVTTLSNEIGNRILFEIKHSYRLKYPDPDIGFKTNKFEIDSWGVKFVVIWFYFNFSKKTGIKNGYKTDAVTDFEHKVIRFNICAIDGKIDEPKVFEMVQHELNHYFEHLRKGMTDFRNPDNYQTAIKNLRLPKSPTEIDDVFILRQRIALVFYLSYKSEQRGFINGSYRYIMRSLEIGNKFNDAIKGTVLYDYVDKINSIGKLLSKVDGNTISQLLFPYKVNYSRFQKIIQRTQRDLLWRMGRMMSKALDDIAKNPNIAKNASSFEDNQLNEGVDYSETMRKINRRWLSI